MRTRIRRSAVPAVGLLLLMLAACGPGGPAATPSTSLPADLDPARPLLLVTLASGPTLIPESQDPRLATLYGDGTLVTGGEGGDLLGTRTVTLDREALEQAWGVIVRSDLAQDGSLELEGLFDAGTTTFRVDDGTRATELHIYALGVDGDDLGAPFPREEQRLRDNATALLSFLRGLAGTDPYVPPALLLWVQPLEAGVVPAAVVPWTPALDLAPIAAGGAAGPYGMGCRRLDGDDAAALAPFLAATPAGTVVEQAGVRYEIRAVRPIYPDEPAPVDCPAGG